jgi:hypothetical protein
MGAMGLYDPPEEGGRDDKCIDKGDGNANKDKDSAVANVNAVCPPHPPPTLLLLCGAVTIGGIPPSTYLSSNRDNNNDNVGMMAGVGSFLGNQLRSHRDNNADKGSKDNADNVDMEEEGSYDNNLGNELSSLSCLNYDGCDMVEVDELLVKDIANMLLECLPMLRQVRVGYVVKLMSTTCICHTHSI